MPKREAKSDELPSSKQQSENEMEMVNSDQIETATPATNPFSNEKVPKRKKVKRPATIEDSEVSEAQNNNDADDGKSNVMPTPPPSKRQKKRQKKEQNSMRSKDKECEKTISYLTKWDLSRDEWKYEKLRQIHIQKNIFDESIILDECIDVAIRYLSTSKGHARTIITQAAEKVIKEIEEKITDDNQDELTSSCPYERARKVLQSMQDE